MLIQETIPKYIHTAAMYFKIKLCVISAYDQNATGNGTYIAFSNAMQCWRGKINPKHTNKLIFLGRLLK